jgi:hypothetical protein
MTTGFAIILTAYLIGYFISVGLIIGIEDDEDTFSTVCGAICMSFLSWINIGVYLADFLPYKQKSKQ